MADAGYTGAPFAKGVRQLLGASMEIVRRSELHTFAVMPTRWVVERSFAWRETALEELRTHAAQLAVRYAAFLALLLQRY